MIKLKDSSILMFIPRFLRNDKKIKNLITAIDTVLKEVLERFSSMKRMQKIAEGDLTDEEIEFLLWENHVDYFDKTLTKEQKIKLIQNAERAHLKKGTRAVLENHLKIIFGELQLQEWFEYESDPIHFRIVTDNNIPEETIVKINRTADEFRTVRSTYDGVVIKQKEKMNFSFAMAMHDISLESYKISLQNDRIDTYAGIATHEISIENERIGG